MSGRWPQDLRRLSWAAALGAALWAVALATPARAGPIDEVHVGVLGHSVTHSGRLEAGTYDYLLEFDTARPELLRPLGSPRVSIAFAVNSQHLSNLASVGLVWDRRLYDRLYGSVDLGFGVTDGLVRPRPGPDRVPDFENRLLLGSHVLFRAAAALDWRLTDRWSIGIELVHASNGNLLGPHPFNRGINDAGFRIGYRFN